MTFILSADVGIFYNVIMVGPDLPGWLVIEVQEVQKCHEGIVIAKTGAPDSTDVVPRIWVLSELRTRRHTPALQYRVERGSLRPISRTYISVTSGEFLHIKIYDESKRGSGRCRCSLTCRVSIACSFA